MHHQILWSVGKDTCFIITEPDSIVVNLIGISEISCADSINGAIDISPAGGTIAADYQFDWDIDGTGDNDDSEEEGSRPPARRGRSRAR